MVDDLAPDEDAEAGGFAAELDHDGTFQPAPLSEWAKPIPSRYGPTVNVAECVASIHTTAAPITNKLRSLLQVRSLSHYEYGQKKGKLVQGALATLALTNNDRVFKRKVESDTLDVAVSILLDMSGSMDGTRIQNATLAVAALSKALSVVRVAHCVTGFTNSFEDGKPMHIPVVQWDRPTHADNIPTEVSKWKLCDNADGEHILRAANELMQRKEKRKLLVVMSDGSPECARRPKGLKRYTMDLIKYLEEKTPIEVMSLGMMYDTSRLYKRSVCVNKAEDIPSGLLSLLSSSF
jgi:cobalamin biosynthesis protein CobT